MRFIRRNSEVFFFRFAAAILFVAAAMKAFDLALSFPGTSSRDPILWFLPINVLQVFLIGLELWVATFVMSDRIREQRYLALLFLSSGFLGYRASKWYSFRDSSCDCLGSVFARWGGERFESLPLVIAVFLFTVSFGVLFGSSFAVYKNARVDTQIATR